MQYRVKLETKICILFALDVSPIMKLLSLKDPDQKTEIKYLHFVLENHLTFLNLVKCNNHKKIKMESKAHNVFH